MNGPAGTSEDGAVAVLVALLAVVLFGIAAFVTDLGLAYSRQRQLQTAADGAALAAAQSFADIAGPTTSCTAVVSGGAAAAVAAAVSYQQANQPPGGGLQTGAPPTGWLGTAGVAYRCNPIGNVEVRVTNAGTSPAFFGSLLGRSGYDLGTRAIAAMGPPNAVTGLRPFAVCAGVADALMQGESTNPGQNQLVSFDKVFNSSAPAGSAPCGSASGNWGTLDFDGGSNPVGDIALWTDIGYQQPIDLGSDLTITFPGDPGFPNANSGNCSASDGCVTSGTSVGGALSHIIGRPTILPVFRTVTGSGSNAQYQVTGFLGVTICGWKLGNQQGTVPTYGGTACYQSSPANIALPTSNGSADNAFQVRVERFIPIGDLSSFCGLAGSPVVCNTNLRVVQLVE